MHLRTAALILLCCPLLAVAAERVYKWTDADGVTHYSQTPPPTGTQFEESAVAVDPANPSAPEPGNEAPRTVPAAQARTQACERARLNLDTLNANPQVTMDKDGDGRPDVLTSDEHANQIELAQRQVNAFCNAPAAPEGGSGG